MTDRSLGEPSPRHQARTEIWRRLPYHVGPSARHVAMSDRLVRHGRVPTIWWHSTDSPTLLLGAGQTLNGAARRDETVRRHAGGTAVLAGPGVLGLDVMLPAGHPLAPPDIVEAYRWLGETWVGALSNLSIDAHLVTIAEARAAPRDPALAAACFGSLSPYEVTVAGRKVVGLAQVRRTNGTLLQAGVHLRFDADALASALYPGNPGPFAERLRLFAMGLHEVTDAGADTIMDAFHRALTDSLGIALRDGEWSIGEMPT
ncbi:MAG TPA: hypothetical protein VFB58_07970 [Chloroflexota bacterium]|nr:hypothetical protein [Chloroflexota bacterium]